MKVIQVGREISFDVDELVATPPPVQTPATPPPEKKSAADKTKTEKKSASVPQVIALILFIGILASSAVAVFFYVGKQEENAARLKLESELRDVTAAKGKVELKLEELEHNRLDLENRLALQRSNYEGTLALYQEKQREYDQLQTVIEENVTRITDLRGSLSAAERENKKLTDKMAQLLGTQQELSEQLQQVQSAKQALEQRMITMGRRGQTRGVELGTIVVDSAVPRTELAGLPADVAVQALPAPAKVEGQILVVNKEFAFVVINVGQKDGLTEGAKLSVFRGQKQVGAVEIERVYDTMSSAVILPDVTREPLLEGDAVKVY